MNDAETESRQLRYQGRVVDVLFERVRLPNNDVVDLDIVKHPGGAAVVAIDPQHRVCMLRQYRHAAGGWLWELPAGKLDPGEPPENTARRELLEEAGLSAGRWTSLGILHSSPGVFTEVIHLYLAQELATRELAHEHGELIEVHWQDLSVVVARCQSGEITDAKTLIGIFRAAGLLAAQGPSAAG